jgi:hypothetical protein
MCDWQKRQVTGTPGLFMTDIQEARVRIWRLLKNFHVDSDISASNMMDSDVLKHGVRERQVLGKGE